MVAEARLEIPEVEVWRGLGMVLLIYTCLAAPFEAFRLRISKHHELIAPAMKPGFTTLGADFG